MSESNQSPVVTKPLGDKQKLLKTIRHEIKKKRLLLDEGKERFGMDEMSQLMKVKNTSEVKGYPFKISKSNSVLKETRIALKVVPIETKYEKHEHPCQLENLVLRELTENIVNKDISPHITYYLGTQKVNNKSRALKQLNLKRLEVEEKIRTHSNMLISEYVEGGSLDSWVFDTYENDQEITDEQWKSIVFQLIYTIAVIQHHYRMMHNDFHYGNILIDNTVQPGGYFVYEIGNQKFYVPNTGVIPKLWDFEFSMVYSNRIADCYPNKFITGPFEYDKRTHTTIVKPEDLDEDDEEYNVPYNYNEVYDLHYFLTSLLDLYISQELFDWIMDIYPEELIPPEESSERSYYSSEADSEKTQDSDDSLKQHSDTKDEDDTDGNSDTESEDDNDNDTESENEHDTATESEDDTATDTESEKQYLSDGRMINGIEKEFDLPTPKSMLSHPFFKTFTEKPADFDEATAIVFKAGF
ncbi:MAG: hypothetical protein EBU90_04790 [Proteobacteria bacterium]|nr:hypothetical protein [Pseudomonadota bacterium]NBP13765.1 hypothetical protein [bacterium]